LLGEGVDAKWAKQILNVYDLDGNAALDVAEQDNFWKDLKTDGGILNDALGGDGEQDETGEQVGTPVEFMNGWDYMKTLISPTGSTDVSNAEFMAWVHDLHPGIKYTF